MKKFVLVGVVLVILVAIGFLVFRYNIKAGAESSCVASSNTMAVANVRNLPEVKVFLAQLSKENGKVELEKTTSKYFQVHVYEIVDDGEFSHTATFNWYIADSCSGTIISAMHLYDKEGNYQSYNSDYDKYLID